MHVIRAIQREEAGALAALAATTFRQSHGSSTTNENINAYIEEHYTEQLFQHELSKQGNHYYYLCLGDKPIGFLNFITDCKHDLLRCEHPCKLDRIYLLEDYLGQQAGLKLFQFALQEAKRHKQEGFWLNVWEGNQRAINFYRKLGFVEIGKSLFRISATHSNPNLVLFLEF